MASAQKTVIFNPDAKKYTLPDSRDSLLVRKFHESLPSFAPTPLVPLEDVAKELGVRAVFIKDESNRLGLPAFKILGASWGTFRAIAEKLGLQLETVATLDDIKKHARAASLELFAATEGNHGRAVARMASLLGLDSNIFVPDHLDKETRGRIEGERGASVTPIDGDYDAAVRSAAKEAGARENGVLVQDNSFEGYETVPAWIVDGYSTMLLEVKAQLEERGLKPTAIVTPVGVGSLALSVVKHCKSAGRALAVLTVEPDTAGCLHKSLKEGKMVQLTTSKTIMSGLNCGTVSPTAWPLLQAGVDSSVTVSDLEAHQTVECLKSKHGIALGPCGAAGLSALRHVAASKPESIRLTSDSVIVILGTEGSRPYEAPIDIP